MDVDDATLPVEPSAQPTELQRGTKIGRYLVESRLGGGGMGVVFAALDPELNRRVAIKLLRAGSNAQADARLLREAQALAKLAHPNVITVHDVGTFKGSVFVAMELVDGQHLEHWLGVDGRTEPQILEAFLDAGRGLAAAHAAGIVHRDFKPENVVVGKDGRVRVLDFGLAREAVDDGAPASIPVERGAAALSEPLTQTGAVMGTPRYMAPEQFLGRDTDQRTDQFSFCVALYEALYHQRPFEGETFFELAKNVTESSPRPPPTVQATNPDLHEAIERGLASAPDARHPSMQPLLRILDRVVRTTQRATAAPTAAPVAPTKRGRWALLGLAVIGCVAVLVTPGFRRWLDGPSKVSSLNTSTPMLSGPALRIGQVRYLSVERQRGDLAALGELLRSQLGRPVEETIIENHVEAEKKLRSGQLDIASINPLGYVRIKEAFPETVLLTRNVVDGANTYQGLIISKRSSGLTKLASLRGTSAIG